MVVFAMMLRLLILVLLLVCSSISCSHQSVQRGEHTSNKVASALQDIADDEWTYLFDGYHQGAWFSLDHSKAKIIDNQLVLRDGLVLLSDENYKDFILEVVTNASGCDLAVGFKPFKEVQPDTPSANFDFQSTPISFNPGDDTLIMAGTYPCTDSTAPNSDSYRKYRLLVSDGLLRMINDEGELIAEHALFNKLKDTELLHSDISRSPTAKIALYGRDDLAFESIRIARYRSAKSMTNELGKWRANDERWLNLLSNAQLNPSESDGIGYFWQSKVMGEKAGRDRSKIFSLDENELQIRFDQQDNFNNRFAHLYFGQELEAPFTLSAEYRFFNYQAGGAPAWAYRNSGLMLFTDPVDSIPLNQEIPRSIEAQLLSADADRIRTTGNVCTPGTRYKMDDALITQHCVYSTSSSFTGDDWMNIEVQVSKTGRIKQFINGELVFDYHSPENDDGTPLTKGYFALQAESQNMAFRNVLLRR